MSENEGSTRYCQGYEIIKSGRAGEREVVTLYNPKAPDSYVCWYGRRGGFTGVTMETLTKRSGRSGRSGIRPCYRTSAAGKREGRGENGDDRRGKLMVDPKAVKLLNKMEEAGFFGETDLAVMTMDDILSLPGVTVAEIGRINRLQKSIQAGWVLSFLRGEEEV